MLEAWAWDRLRLLCGALLIGVALAGCATRADQVTVSVGPEFPEIAAANDYAALYTPYAMMATAAYANDNVLTKLNNCPDVAKLGVRQRGDADDTFAFNKTVRGWVAYLQRHAWECRFGVIGSLGCPQRLPGCSPVGGLEFHVWRRMVRGQCRAVVIAFRGSDSKDLGDWQSNFRWLYRLAPKFDQYAQVRTHIGEVIARVKKSGCNGPTIVFAAVGHSLGGGLAQQAAYANGTIRYVYAFDPSPVTGFFDVSAIVRDRNVVGLGVDRAYESGEILALPRILIENIFPPRACGPRVRKVRFSMLTGLPLQQHNMEALTERLRAAARMPGADPRRVEARQAANDCVPSLLMLPLPEIP